MIGEVIQDRWLEQDTISPVAYSKQKSKSNGISGKLLSMALDMAMGFAKKSFFTSERLKKKKKPRDRFLHSLDKPVFSERKFSVYLVENSSIDEKFPVKFSE